MCTDRDCKIFRGMLVACDDCERMNERLGGGRRISAPAAMVGPKSLQMP